MGEDDDATILNLAQEANIFSQTILHDAQNVSIGGTNYSQFAAAVDVRPGDTESLRAYLISVGLAHSDVNALPKAIMEDRPPLAQGSFGRRVSHWLGNMTERAAMGVASRSMTVIASGVTQALLRHYGWS
ncbi:MAG: hypothetical protein WBW04_03750 [Nitrolancea sp.]